MEPQNKSNKGTGLALGVVVMLAVAAATFFFGRKQDALPADQTPSPANDTPAADSAVGNTSVIPASQATGTAAPLYKDGTYSAEGSYISPGGPDKIAVTLTLSNDVITAASVTPEPGDGTSARYQNMFVSGYKQYVLGKDISTVHLTKVSGSSLTPGGFDDALAKIKAQAQA